MTCFVLGFVHFIRSFHWFIAFVHCIRSLHLFIFNFIISFHPFHSISIHLVSDSLDSICARFIATMDQNFVAPNSNNNNNSNHSNANYATNGNYIPLPHSQPGVPLQSNQHPTFIPHVGPSNPGPSTLTLQPATLQQAPSIPPQLMFAQPSMSPMQFYPMNQHMGGMEVTTLIEAMASCQREAFDFATRLMEKKKIRITGNMLLFKKCVRIQPIFKLTDGRTDTLVAARQQGDDALLLLLLLRLLLFRHSATPIDGVSNRVIPMKACFFGQNMFNLPQFWDASMLNSQLSLLAGLLTATPPAPRPPNPKNEGSRSESAQSNHS